MGQPPAPVVEAGAGSTNPVDATQVAIHHLAGGTGDGGASSPLEQFGIDPILYLSMLLTLGLVNGILGRPPRRSHHSGKMKPDASFFSATSSQRRCIHSALDLLAAAAAMVSGVADCLPDAADSVAEKTGNQLGPQGGAGPSGSSSLLSDAHPQENKIPPQDPYPKGTAKFLKEAAEYVEKQFQDTQIQRLAKKEEAALTHFMQSIDDLKSAQKRLEYDIFLGNERTFYIECNRILPDSKFPLLDPKLLSKDVDVCEEEAKLVDLVRFLLRSRNKEYNIENLWRLRKDMHKPGVMKSDIFPLIARYAKKRGRR